MTRIATIGVGIVGGLFLFSVLCMSFNAEAKGKPGGGGWSWSTCPPCEYDDSWSYHEWDGGGLGYKDIQGQSFDPLTGDVVAAHGSIVPGYGHAEIAMYNGMQGPTFTCYGAKIVGFAKFYWILDWEATTGNIYGGTSDTEAYIKVCGNMCTSQGYWLRQNNAELEICSFGGGINYESGDALYVLEFPITLYYGESYTFWASLETYTYAEATVGGSDAAVSVTGELAGWAAYGDIVGPS